SECVEIGSNLQDSFELECGTSPQYMRRLLLLVIAAFLAAFVSDRLRPTTWHALSLIVPGVVLVAAIWLTLVSLKKGAVFYLKKIDTGASVGQAR
ncbi:MAG TPA: hypothetical protein V6C72_04315, partial [Chroococcales cyanobacterium]